MSLLRSAAVHSCFWRVGCDLTDDVTRLADPQGDAGWEHGGDHLRGVRPHGKCSTPGRRCRLAHEASHAGLCLQGQRVLAASFDKSALLWRLGDSIPKVTMTTKPLFHLHLMDAPFEPKSLRKDSPNVISLSPEVPQGPYEVRKVPVAVFLLWIQTE